ncbi:hypothetical protein NQP46_10335 [Streptomyces albus]|nr:hypothetical protein NQP46_10335 [Streptomyces albus]
MWSGICRSTESKTCSITSTAPSSAQPPPAAPPHGASERTASSSPSWGRSTSHSPTARSASGNPPHRRTSSAAAGPSPCATGQPRTIPIASRSSSGSTTSCTAPSIRNAGSMVRLVATRSPSPGVRARISGACRTLSTTTSTRLPAVTVRNRSARPPSPAG